MLGVLWMDDSENKLAKKVAEAAQAYQRHFGVPANLCYANPADVPETVTIGRVRVEPRSNILPNHFLAGRDTAAQEKERAA